MSVKGSGEEDWRSFRQAASGVRVLRWRCGCLGALARPQTELRKKYIYIYTQRNSKSPTSVDLFLPRQSFDFTERLYSCTEIIIDVLYSLIGLRGSRHVNVVFSLSLSLSHSLYRLHSGNILTFFVFSGAVIYHLFVFFFHRRRNKSVLHTPGSYMCLRKQQTWR